jgi:hypothetical protein
MAIDRQRLRKRMRIILTVGGILIALAYAVPRAQRMRVNWQRYRAAASVEVMHATGQGKRATEAELVAKAYEQKGWTSEAEQSAKSAKNLRRREAMHRRKADEYLRRWW